jgi:hypothetical protein
MLRHMPERRYNDEEAAAIFLSAAEGPGPAPLHAPRDQGLTLADLQNIGREVGIPPDAVAQAAQSLALRARAPSRTFLGLPIAVGRTVELDRRLTDGEWEQLVVALRETFDARGTVTSTGALRQWTNGNLHALLEPTATGHRLRLGTLNGSARGAMRSGLAFLGVAAAVTLASLLGGAFGNALPGIGFLAIAGAGLFANGALRLPSWARLRERQMEAIAGRLIPPAPSPATE